MKIFDTHCHLGGEELFPQAEVLAERAHAAGVAGLALISADAFSLRACPELRTRLQKKFPALQVVWSCGLHPHEAEKIDESLWQEVLTLAPTAQAIGETGLDYFYDHSPRDIQKEYFERHIELAIAAQKPLVIHCRQAAEDILSHLASHRQAWASHPRPGILHCFTEDTAVAKKLLDLGFVISFSGILTFKNAQTLREAAQFVPVDRMLIETDSPWLAPVPQRGSRNEPAFVVHVFEEMLRVKGLEREILEAVLWRNSCRIFNIEGHGGNN